MSLVEVLVGVAIASVGIVGVLELQKKFIKSGNQINARAIAMQLTREKFDELKQIDDFTLISDSTDPKETVGAFDFTRSVTTLEWHYDSSNDSWSNASSDTNELSGKSAKVSTTWIDLNGDEQSVEQTQVFSKVSIHDTSNGFASLAENQDPQIPFTSDQTPESPPIDLIDDSFVYEGVGDSKETSKPIPTVYAWEGNNLIQFETVVYDPDSDTQTLEDFATVNCSCSLAGEDLAYTPVTYTLSNDDSALENDDASGQEILKTVGIADAKQPFLCDTCCRDHHDVTTVDEKYSSLSTAESNHIHYDAGLDVATSSYIEACRLRRVDGFYKVVPDWKLVDVVVMPLSYFDVADNVDDYVNYVKYVVKEYVSTGSYDSTPIEEGVEIDLKAQLLPNRNFTLSSGSQQLIARGIYVDLASISKDLTTIQGYVSTKANWLEYVPFYEVNLSLFGEWFTSDSAVVTVTNEEINTIVDEANDYYGTYSRGRITPQPASSFAEISVFVNTDNTGITGSGLINPSISNLGDSIVVTVDNTGTSHTITLEIDCLAFNNRGIYGSCQNSDTENVNFRVTGDSAIACTYSAQRGSSTAFLSCSGVPSGWSGDIMLSSSGFDFYIDDDGDPDTDLVAVSQVTVDIDNLVAPYEESLLMKETPATP